MGTFDTFAKRKRAREKSGQTDVYQYDMVPPFLRKQVALILEATLGPYVNQPYVARGNENWDLLASTMEREFETFPGRSKGDAMQRCMVFLGTEEDAGRWLSLVEFACRVLRYMASQGAAYQRQVHGAKQNADDALDEINARFRESAFGYEFRNGEIIRIDEQFLHAEVVRPALALLAAPGFEKANEDFMAAHRHYREGNSKDAIVAANRAFESTLKAICAARKWAYDRGARASDLVTLVRTKGLFPHYLGAGMDTYIALLKTGLPGVRNEAGGHGDDPGAPAVPSYVASYAIHLTATTIVLLMNAHNNK